MVPTKQKRLRLSQSDLELLARLQGEFLEAGINISESDIIAMGLKQLEKQGGSIETLYQEVKRGKKKSA